MESLCGQPVPKLVEPELRVVVQYRKRVQIARNRPRDGWKGRDNVRDRVGKCANAVELAAQPALVRVRAAPELVG